MQETKFTSLRQYLFGRLFPRNANKTHRDQSALQVLFICLKRNDSQTFKKAATKNFLSSVRFIDTTFFGECF